MPRKLPANILNELKETVRTLADAHRYLERSQIENTAFIDQLARHPHVGARIQEFMGPHEVRHYIKDAILKKYAKAKRQPPKDVSACIKAICPKKAHLIETAEEGIVSLYRCEDGECLVIAKVSHRRWETGLRRVLLYVARNQAIRLLPRPQLRLALLIMLHGTNVTEADRKMVERALAVIDVIYHWIA